MLKELGIKTIISLAKISYAFFIIAVSVICVKLIYKTIMFSWSLV